MILDCIRSAFTTVMWLWGPDRPPVPVRWFFTLPGAKLFPHAHSFWAVDWEIDKGYKGENDLIGERGKWHNGSTLVPYTGQEFHGPAQAFLDGGRWGIDPELVTGDDGSIPECRVPPGSPPVLIAGRGGQRQGGRAIFSTDSVPLLGTGGQGQGGEAHQCARMGFGARGGQGQGGEADQGGDNVLIASGGEEEGGNGGMCHDGPTWVGGTAQTGFSDTVAAPVAAGTVVGDTVVVVILAERADALFDLPLGYVPVLLATIPGEADDTIAVYKLTYLAGPIPPSVSVHETHGAPCSAVCFTLRGAQEPSIQNVLFGDGIPGTIPSADIRPVESEEGFCALVTRIFFNGGVGQASFDIRYYTQWNPVASYDNIAVWYREHVFDHFESEVTVTNNSESDWAGVTLVWYPPPMP